MGYLQIQTQTIVEYHKTLFILDEEL